MNNWTILFFSLSCEENANLSLNYLSEIVLTKIMDHDLNSSNVNLSIMFLITLEYEPSPSLCFH